MFRIIPLVKYIDPPLDSEHQQCILLDIWTGILLLDHYKIQKCILCYSFRNFWLKIYERNLMLCHCFGYISGNIFLFFSGFPPIRKMQEIFEIFFQSGKSEKNRGFSAKIRELFFKTNFKPFKSFNLKKSVGRFYFWEVYL